MMLAESGVEALTIDAMCAHLKVTKGSFYHHFANRESFLENVLQHWEAKFTERFITVSQDGATPLERMQRLNRLVIETYGTSEVAIRAWAQTDPMAAVYQQHVDQKRLDYLYQLSYALSGDEMYAQTFARIAYAILIGAQTIMPAYSTQQLAQVYDLLEKMTAAYLRNVEP